MNYQVIVDPILVQEFIDWLPDTKPNEQFYCCLFARSKYTRELEADKQIVHVHTDKQQLKRFTTTKENLFFKLKQLECEVGSYWQKGRICIPQEALAMYINPSPRDLTKASFKSLQRIAQLLGEGQVDFNPHQEVMSCIQQSKPKNGLILFDIDSKDVDFSGLNEIVDERAYTIIETRGGFHLLIDPSKVEAHKKTFYRAITTAYKVDITGDALIPIVGSYQGGFVPKFLVKG